MDFFSEKNHGKTGFYEKRLLVEKKFKNQNTYSTYDSNI